MLATPTATALAPYYEIVPVPGSPTQNHGGVCALGGFQMVQSRPADMNYGYVDDDQEKNQLGSVPVLQVKVVTTGPCSNPTPPGGVDAIIQEIIDNTDIPVHVEN